MGKASCAFCFGGNQRRFGCRQLTRHGKSLNENGFTIVDEEDNEDDEDDDDEDDEDEDDEDNEDNDEDDDDEDYEDEHDDEDDDDENDDGFQVVSCHVPRDSNQRVFADSSRKQLSSFVISRISAVNPIDDIFRDST